MDDLAVKVRQGRTAIAPDAMPHVERWVESMLQVSSVIRSDAVMRADYQPERL